MYMRLDIENRINEFDPNSFQRLCDELIKEEYDNVSIRESGLKERQNKPTKGNPDAYIKVTNGLYY